ncbi:ATP-dependent helicase [Mobilitalea sibirica]|uniref:DNA 3'-5' helicase n=1 Tax=Mobilitalea sibirica TaxID=1462919 RepID=A0A8J7HD63_9FIRM|nr:ATP-dependent helicase [Mobilitalea sibirica]MBH1941692.1 ATP-dependent helicase [Mobilitalea sibirica]
MYMNKAQQQAVVHKEGPMLVLAGPGSGKTLVITERTKRLIELYQIQESNILVITFTKAAANEMKERFLKSIGKNRTGASFGTFHAVFFTILKHAYRLNSKNIIREDLRFHYLKEIIHRLELEFDDEKDFIMDLLSEISLVKSNRINLENYYSSNCGDEIFRIIYKEYDSRLKQSHLIDFDDMLILCHQLLKERQDILKQWQNKFQYILIDEFQDINQIQYEIVRMLAAPQNNLFIVGDDDQSIYRFRGAKPEIMLNFPKDYPGCERLVLSTNYRSTKNIVQTSIRLVSHNQNRYEKEVNAIKDEGGKIQVLQFQNLAEENQRLSEEIIKLRREGIALKDMAILVRTNMGFGALLHKLMEYNIPFQMRDTLPNLYDHWITRDIIAYIKLAMGSVERSLFLQIINRPKRYVSRECFDTPEINFEDVKSYYEDKSWMLERLEQMEYDLYAISKMGPFAAVNYIRRGVGYEDYLKEYSEQRKIKTEDLLEILDELQESAKSYQTFEAWFGYMEAYKEELKQQAEESKRDNIDRITIATMHSSKGLEFEVVFIVDANEGITPHKKAVLAADIEEERRLFYVAMTRAKEYLYILSAKDRYNKNMEISRFVSELKEDKK